jgi:tetratricopeptide (TPR) repeat protein
MRFSRYELLSRLGAGGMGEVWRARDHDLHRDVAVKFLPERFAADPARMGRFAQEARAASSLNHPNIVTIHEIGETSGLPFIVMELVEGHTLREVILGREQAPVSTRRLLETGAQIADGLAKAHAAGIVHRDLKPENVMVTTDGFVKILDFGLAKLLTDGSGESERWFDSAAPTWPESPSPQTAVGAVLGTAGYMSPEQARGRPVDFRSDQFTFGAILYEMATGRQAFRRETPAQTIAAIIDDPPEPLASLNPALPAPLRWVIDRCLAKDPADRYASTFDLARELRGVREHLPEVDSTGSSPATAGGRRARLWRGVAQAAAVVAALVAVAWGLRETWAPVGPPTRGRPPVVAVLPVSNLTGQPEHDATAVGIAEVVVTGLSAIDGVQVLSRSATTSLADRKGDIPGVARLLDATYVVDGSLQRSEQKLRVSLSLVDSRSNVVRWSDTFDGAFPQLFELQSLVAGRVARALSLSLSGPQQARAEAHPTASPSAWDEYARALSLLDRSDRPGYVARAIAHLETALAADPRFARAHAALGRALWMRYRETGDAALTVRARQAAEEALRLDPADAETHSALAEQHSGQGRLEEAIAEARRAVALAPETDDHQRQLAYLLSDAGRPEEALATARRAVELRPAFGENHAALGWVLFHTGRFREAALAYRKQSELQPDNAWAFQMLGTALQMLGDYDGAVGPYREAIRLAPDARAWANLGAVYHAQGSAAEAVRAYEEAVRLEPASGTIRRSLGDARAKAGDAAGARAEWGRAIDLSRAKLRVNPQDPRQLKNVALCLAKLGRKDEARRAAAEALAAGPAVADTRYGVASVHALLGDTREALEHLREALALGTSPDLAQRDDEMAPLRSLPEFRALIDDAKKSHKEVNRAS